jgi:peptidyl-prolyl cis-trans isomerase B (cyclophilin B)
MKRYLTLAILVLLAVSCGGRRGHKDADGALEDSLAVAEQAKPATPADSLADLKKLNTLPQEPVFDVATTQGTFRVKLYKDTPKHRDNFVRLALTHFYDGVLFHRVVPGFVIQGGDPYTRDTSRVEEWGEGGPGYNVDAEILPEHTHKKGALAAARRGDLANPLKESSGSQFYVVVNPENCKHLDGEYTVFGEVVSGINVIERIARVQTDRYDRPLIPVKIMRIRPNDQMNRRALEEEQRAMEEGDDILPREEKAKDDRTPEEKEAEIILEVQEKIDSSVLGGRKLKHREK